MQVKAIILLMNSRPLFYSCVRVEHWNIFIAYNTSLCAQGQFTYICATYRPTDFVCNCAAAKTHFTFRLNALPLSAACGSSTERSCIPDHFFSSYSPKNMSNLKPDGEWCVCVHHLASSLTCAVQQPYHLYRNIFFFSFYTGNFFRAITRRMIFCPQALQ